MDKLNRWLTLAANLGVLGGLILVSLQIRQNTEITRAQIENDYFLADMQLELAMMGEDPVESWIKAVYTPDERTREDAAVVDRYLRWWEHAKGDFSPGFVAMVDESLAAGQFDDNERLLDALLRDEGRDR